jgi:hypothetical protein
MDYQVSALSNKNAQSEGIWKAIARSVEGFWKDKSVNSGTKEFLNT